MKQVVALENALDEKLFGSKAVGLGQAVRDGVPVPPGIALSGAISRPSPRAKSARSRLSPNRRGRSADRWRCAPPPPTRTVPGTGIQDNLADKARKLGIPVWKVRGGRA